MFRNYFKIAWRNLWNNKTFSTINIISLAIGLSASFVIGIMVYYDFTFDQFHPDKKRIYRITSNFSSPEGKFYNQGVSVPLGNKLKEGASNIELTTSFYTVSVNKVKNLETEQEFKNIEDIIYTDKNYFQLFQYEWLAGNPKETLSNPNEVILTKKRSDKYFPKLSPQEIIGKYLMYNDSIQLKVIGIVNNFDQRSDLSFQEFFSFKTAISFNAKDQVLFGKWNNTNSSNQVFVKLISNEKKNHLQQQLNLLAKEHTDKEMLAYGHTREFHLQPLSDIHFNSNYGVFKNTTRASKKILISLAFIALFLLILGCINFINLNTANATIRAKEIGVRKTLGSSKKQLIFQFLGETFLLTLASTILSLFFSVWLLQIFSEFIPPDLGFELFTSPIVIVSIMVLFILVTLLSGFYPALVLSRFKPTSILKNQVLGVDDKSSLRKSLTVFQFVIAQIFIVATLLVGQQINYLLTKDMGFKTTAIAYIRAWHDNDLNKRLTFINEIKKIPQIEEISLGGNPPASSNYNSTIGTYYDDQKEIHTSFQYLGGDVNYQNLYDLNLLAGRNRLNDTINEFIINETYMKILGFENPEDAIGKFLKVDSVQNVIVGVMQDFNQRTLKSGIEPMALVGDLFRGEGYSGFHTIHFSLPTENTQNWSKTIGKVENIWKEFYPNFDFNMNFIDESIRQFYDQERKMSILLKWTTGLAILISCLGLLGLVIHTTTRRTKEIGIRKILGASLIQLNLLLCREFIILVGISFVIAAPIAWWGINKWLQDFAFKANISWWVFLLSGTLMLFTALIIMSIRTIASANANPVKSLKTE